MHGDLRVDRTNSRRLPSGRFSCQLLATDAQVVETPLVLDLGGGFGDPPNLPCSVWSAHRGRYRRRGPTRPLYPSHPNPLSPTRRERERHGEHPSPRDRSSPRVEGSPWRTDGSPWERELEGWRSEGRKRSGEGLIEHHPSDTDPGERVGRGSARAEKAPQSCTGSFDWPQAGFDLDAVRLQKRWQRQALAEMGGILVGGESGAVGRDLEEDAARLPKVD